MTQVSRDNGPENQHDLPILNTIPATVSLNHSAAFAVLLLLTTSFVHFTLNKGPHDGCHGLPAYRSARLFARYSAITAPLPLVQMICISKCLISHSPSSLMTSTS